MEIATMFWTFISIIAGLAVVLVASLGVIYEKIREVEDWKSEARELEEALQDLVSEYSVMSKETEQSRERCRLFQESADKALEVLKFIGESYEGVQHAGVPSAPEGSQVQVQWEQDSSTGNEEQPTDSHQHDQEIPLEEEGKTLEELLKEYGISSADHCQGLRQAAYLAAQWNGRHVSSPYASPAFAYSRETKIPVGDAAGLLDKVRPGYYKDLQLGGCSMVAEDFLRAAEE